MESGTHWPHLTPNKPEWKVAPTGYIAQWLERLTADQQVPGSNLGVPSPVQHCCVRCIHPTRACPPPCRTHPHTAGICVEHCMQVCRHQPGGAQAGSPGQRAVVSHTNPSPGTAHHHTGSHRRAACVCAVMRARRCALFARPCAAAAAARHTLGPHPPKPLLSVRLAHRR